MRAIRRFGLPAAGFMAALLSPALSGAQPAGAAGEARRERLRLTKNDHVIGCPLCQVDFPSQPADQQDNQ